MPRRSFISRLGLLLIMLGVAGELGVVWRWLATGHHYRVAQRKYDRALSDAGYEHSRVGSIVSQGRGLYVTVNMGSDGKPIITPAAELYNRQQALLRLQKAVEYERMFYAPLILGIAIPIVLGVTLGAISHNRDVAAAEKARTEQQT